MTRCHDCNSIITPRDVKCLTCGGPAPGHEQHSGFGSSFASLTKILFFAAATITVGSLFSDQTPPFSVCLVSTIVLLLAMKSADKMTDARDQ